MGKTKRKISKPPSTGTSTEPSEIVDAPHSFIIHRGLSCPYITNLTQDFRTIMEPFTAAKLKERKFNRIKDFVSMSSFFHVSHMGIFNKAATQLSFKLIRLPHGPTLTFKVHQFALAKDVRSSLKRQYIDVDAFKTSPLVIMNNFTGDGKHLKLMAHTFQNMFPAINLAQVNLNTIRRCVLFSYNPETSLVEMRHYCIQVVPVGLNKGVKKIIMGKIPNMSKYEDIADFIMHDGGASESEAEDEDQVVLPQALKRRGALENSKTSIKLHELGPRLTMQLMKIEAGLLTGEVLYHDHIVKTEEEKEALRKLVEKKRKLKEQRKKTQAENRARNLKAKTAKSKNKLSNENEEQNENESEDDAKYYEEEVGEKPDEELFKTTDNSSRKRTKIPQSLRSKMKKVKLEKKAKLK